MCGSVCGDPRTQPSVRSRAPPGCSRGQEQVLRAGVDMVQLGVGELGQWQQLPCLDYVRYVPPLRGEWELWKDAACGVDPALAWPRPLSNAASSPEPRFPFGATKEQLSQGAKTFALEQGRWQEP